MKHTFNLAVCFGFLLFANRAQAQTYQPFGADGELLNQGQCSPTYNNGAGSTCPWIDAAASVGTQWIRLFAVWSYLEPTQNSYSWGTLPYAVWYAQQKGISVYLTATWAPQWANGAISTCPPFSGATQTGPGSSTYPQCANGYQDVGRTVTNSTYTYNFFYNLALEFNGSSSTGCSTNAAACRPLVQYFGVWNEPDGMNNFNDTYYDPSDLGNYLNDYASQYLIPAHNGIKAGNSTAYVVASELGTGGCTCGGFSNCGGWANSWMKPLFEYYSSYYDINSVHGYNAESTDKSNILEIWNSYDYGKPIWLTETAYSSTSSLTAIYVDQHNQDSYWTKVFYSAGAWNTPCSGADTLVCSSTSGATYTITSFGTTYEGLYAPH